MPPRKDSTSCWARCTSTGSSGTPSSGTACTAASRVETAASCRRGQRGRRQQGPSAAVAAGGKTTETHLTEQSCAAIAIKATHTQCMHLSNMEGWANCAAPALDALGGPAARTACPPRGRSAGAAPEPPAGSRRRRCWQRLQRPPTVMCPVKSASLAPAYSTAEPGTALATDLMRNWASERQTNC